MTALQSIGKLRYSLENKFIRLDMKYNNIDVFCYYKLISTYFPIPQVVLAFPLKQEAAVRLQYGGLWRDLKEGFVMDLSSSMFWI